MLLDVQMLPLDWILLGLLLFGAVKGFIRGAVRQLLSLGGIFLGLLLAKMFYEVSTKRRWPTRLPSWASGYWCRLCWDS